MADDQALDGGTGSNPYTAAADDVGGVKYQRVKIRVGVDGNAGLDVSTTDPMPVVQTGTPGLPSGAATSANQTSEIAALGAIGDAAYVSGSGSLVALLKGLFAKLPALVGGRVPVDGSGVTQPVSGTFWQATQPVSGTVTANAGSGTLAVSGPVTDAQLRATPVPVSGTVTTSPPANASENVAQINGVTPLMGTGNTGTGSLRVTLATDQVALTNALKVDPSAVTSPVSLANPVQAATATLANVSGSASSVTLQASNAARKGLVIVNDSTAILYVKFGSSASATSFTYFIAGSTNGVPGTLELPVVTYTGIVTGIWASATGAARVTELT